MHILKIIVPEKSVYVKKAKLERVAGGRNILHQYTHMRTEGSLLCRLRW